MAGPASGPTQEPGFVKRQRKRSAIGKRVRNSEPIDEPELLRRIGESDIHLTVEPSAMVESINRIDPDAAVPIAALPQDVRATLAALKPEARRFHGAKFSLAYFPQPVRDTGCGNFFGYMSPLKVRKTKLPFNATMQVLLNQLGDLMGDPNREPPTDSPIPAGFTYVGQFVDHDITLDVSSTLDAATDANTVPNMRTPALDLDSLYGDGPALDPFLFVFPSSGPSSAIKLAFGTNIAVGVGGPGGTAQEPGMVEKTDFDVPRMIAVPHTAIIGDPRNDENLLVSQFHHMMLRFHNAVVDMLVMVPFNGDIFLEAKRIVTHHYQWAVVHDFLERVCGPAAVADALANVVAPIGSPFRMPVEFAVAAYRFGHSMIRDVYWLNFALKFRSLGDVFAFNREPNLPVLSNWVIDINAFLETGVPIPGPPIFNMARKIDSVLANGLEALPGFAGMMALLAQRNLRRGLALGLPSGQGMAGLFGLPPLTTAQLTQGLPANEVAVLQSNAGILLKRTPLWYYILREAAVLENGDRLGPVGARIVASTFVQMLKRDAGSYLNASPAFAPMLPSAVPGAFTFADLAIFAGVTQP